MKKTRWVVSCLLFVTGCATEAQLAGIAAKARIPQECRLIGTTPQIADLGTKKNLDKIVTAMGNGNVIVVTGRHMNPGLLALANTWWGDLYDCENPTQYHGTDIMVLAHSLAHPLDPEKKAESANLRVTSNPEAVHGCRFLVNVNDLTEGEVTHGEYPVRQAVLRYNAAKAGGNIILLTSDPHTGEAYACGAVEGAPHSTELVSPDFIHITMKAQEIEGCREVGPSRARMTINSDGQITVGSARSALELTSQNGGNTLLVVPINNLIAEGTGYRCDHPKP